MESLVMSNRFELKFFGLRVRAEGYAGIAGAISIASILFALYLLMLL
jgi:hypothetical protein